MSLRWSFLNIDSSDHVHDDVLKQIVSDLPVCAAVTGDVTGPCQFPFEYKGQVYTECVEMNNGKRWCSTE